MSTMESKMAEQMKRTESKMAEQTESKMAEQKKEMKVHTIIQYCVYNYDLYSASILIQNEYVTKAEMMVAVQEKLPEAVEEAIKKIDVTAQKKGALWVGYERVCCVHGSCNFVYMYDKI